MEGNTEGLRQDSAFPNNRHEIGISNPPGNNMKVEVVFNTCPSAFAKVHSQVKPVRPVVMVDGELALPHEIHHLPNLISRAVRKISQVLIRAYQQMSCRIRKYVENNEIVFASKENEFFFVMLSGFANTKHTLLRASDIGEVLISPRTPQVIHARRRC